MYRIRKGLAAFIAAFFFLGVGGKAQAVIGIPDDVPASTLLFPFFTIQTDRTNRDSTDTLLVITNTAGPTTSSVSGVAPNVAVHVTVWSINSVHIYDFSVILTPHDVFSCSMFDLLVGDGVTGCENDGTKIAPAPSGVVDLLTPPPGADKGLVAGYVTADVVFSPTFLFPGQSNYPFGYGNVLVGQLYLVNLPAGSSTGVNATSIESALQCYGQAAVSFFGGAGTITNSGGFYRTRCEDEQGSAACAPQVALLSCNGADVPYGDHTERIDGPNGDFAQTNSAGGFELFPTNTLFTPDSPLSLIVRYFSATELNANSIIWLWKDRIAGSATTTNVAVYDEAENVHSVTFGLPGEVNFAATAEIITPGVPGGWFRITFPCGGFSSCTYNYTNPPGSVSSARPPIQAVAYSLQRANSGPGLEVLRWDALFPAHRQYTNY